MRSRQTPDMVRVVISATVSRSDEWVGADGEPSLRSYGPRVHFSCDPTFQMFAHPTLGYSPDSVCVGRDCFIGIRSVVSEGSIMEDGARLEDLSLLERGMCIPLGETWTGSPAQRVNRARVTNPPPPRPSPLQRAAIAALYAALVPMIPILLLFAFVPGVIFLTRLDPVTQPLLYLATAPLVGASFVLLLTTEAVALKWLIVGRVRAGTYPVHGGFYVRNWLVDQLLE